MSQYKDIMCNFSNIREAYRLAHKGKSNTVSVIEFDKNKIHNLFVIKNRLETKQWSLLFRYYRFTIHEPKERLVDAMFFDGRIVQHILCDKILRPVFEPRLVKENAACRKNKGTDYAIKLLRQNLVRFRKKYGSGYTVQIDIHKYFPSINRAVLK